MQDLFRLHESRWHRRGEDGVCADAAARAFHLAAAEALHRAGMLRLFRLRIGSILAAVYYGLCARGTAYAYLSGFDPDLPRFSPGLQIVAHAIEQAIEEGAVVFDFLRGRESYKYAWGAVDRANFARTLRPCRGC